MPQPEETTQPGPYAAAAAVYWAAGWRGLLPLPPHSKTYPPTGYTGRTGQWPSYADILTWAEDKPDANIALRMPPDVIGIDVDQYPGKNGAATLDDLEHRLGPLPPTWRSTSRDDTTSSIRFYRVPEGMAWPGEAGADVEIIQTRHRYAVVAPSVHPSGGVYRWINPDGAVVIHDMPTTDDLPLLPDTWVTALTRGEIATDVPKLDIDDTVVQAWLDARPGGEPCGLVRRANNRWKTDLDAKHGSRHAIARDASMRLVRLAAEGHPGAAASLTDLRAAFLAALDDGSRQTGEAEAEWARLVVGAVQVAAAGDIGTGDPCTFGDLVTAGAVISGTTGPAVPPALPHPATAPDDHHDTAPPPARERTSWWPVDLTAALTGQNPEPPPEYLQRSDGQALFYPGRVNGLIAPSESGKTWVALLGVQQAINDGTTVTYLDFEDTAPGIVQRLVTMGCTPATLRDRFAYIGPDAALDALSGSDLSEHLDAWHPGLVIVDGVNAAMTLLGLDLISNTDATRFAQTLLRPISSRGCAVVYVDHTPKSKDNDSKGGIGAQAKRAMTTGCALRVEVIKEFGIGQSGKLRMRVDKDRPGYVRGASLPGQGGHWAGDVDLTSNPDGSLSVVVTAPQDRPESRRPFRPTTLMERVSAFLSTVPEGASKAIIEREVQGDNNGIRTAIDTLVNEGYAERHGGPRGAVIVRLNRPYTEVGDLTSLTSLRPRSDLAAASWEAPASDLAAVPPSLRGDSEVSGLPWTDENTTTSLPADQDQIRACRTCGEILGADRVLVRGQCSDCVGKDPR